MTDGGHQTLRRGGIVGFLRHRKAIIVACIVLLIPPLLVLLFVCLIAWGLPAAGSGRTAVDYLAALPTNPGLYVYLALLIGLVGAWRSWVHLAPKLSGAEHVDGEVSPALHERIARTQRRRALALRTGATFLLMGVLLLLASGLYLVLFVLPHVIDGYDHEARLEAEFRKRYSGSLDALVAGRFWLSVPREGRVSFETSENQLVAFSTDGQFGVGVPGSTDEERGFVLVSTDRGRSWSRRPGIALGDALKSVVFVGPHVLALSERGAPYTTTHGADSWTARDPDALDWNDQVASAWRSRDEEAVIVLGRSGAFRLTKTQFLADSWGTPSWRLNGNWSAPEEDWITHTKFNNDGSIGVVARRSGRFHVLGKGSEAGDGLNVLDVHPPPLSGDGDPVAAAFSANGQYGVVGGSFGFLQVTGDGGISWRSPASEGLREIDGWAAAALAEDAPNGILLGVDGSVFVTDDYGSLWNRKNSLELELGETLTGGRTVSFSAEAKHGVVVGSKGSVFVTIDGGNSWHFTSGLNPSFPLRVVATVASEAGLEEPDSAVAIDAQGGFHLLRPHVDLAGWSDWSISEIMRQLQESQLRRDSTFLEHMEGFLSSRAGTQGTRLPGVRTDESAGAQGLNVLFNPLLFLRIFTLTIVFFLVALLVRLYQYSLRLAAFWESRSDAVLLAGERVGSHPQSFAELVDALSPDTHDFKRGPQSAAERAASVRFWNRRDS